MKKTIFKFILLTMVPLILVGFGSCKKESSETGTTLQQLYKIYKNGEIDECQYKGEIVYCAERNAYDAGSGIYDKNGKQIGSCNYGWGNVDSVCRQLIGCEVIYRVKDNIWGQPAVDKYELGK